MAKLLPILFLILGTGAGVGAGVFLAPGGDDTRAAAQEQPDDPIGQGPVAAPQETRGAGTDDMGSGREYVRMNNQFVVPVVSDERVTALVVLSLSLEIEAGRSEAVYAQEPKLRDLFLQVLFDHANMGGFNGAFTSANMLDVLRMSLLEAARGQLGSTIRQILIIDIARQDA